MNREDTIEAIKVMQAFVDKNRVRTAFGQELEPQGHCYPDWNWSKGLDQYVISPEPIERWIAVWEFNTTLSGVSHTCYTTRSECENACSGAGNFVKAIKLVEEI